MTAHSGNGDTNIPSIPPVPPLSVPLDPTGVPGLDEVLGGGIQRGSLAILAGPPGGGKTILAHQIAFAAARTGRRTSILTAFSEPTNKLIAHMRPFTFFDQDLLGQSLDVLSMQQFLRQGLEVAASEIVGAVRAAKANLVVLDGFRGVRETAERPEEARRFIYEVSNRLSLLGVTLLLTSEANVRDAAFFLEATTADVLLGLAFDAIAARERRTLEVLKVRGAAPLSGQHALAIGDDGVTVYPRLEARVARLAGADRLRLPQTAPNGREDAAPTGVAGLDALLAGGLTRGGGTLLVGARGAGKTLFALQFATAGVRAGESCLFVGFRETAEQLRRKTVAFDWGGRLRSALDSGALTLLRAAPVELRVDVLADTLLTLLDETGARRLVIDEMGEVERALAASGYAHRFHDFMAALIEILRLRHVTALFTRQTAPEGRAALERELAPSATLTENLFWLRARPQGSGVDRSLVIAQTATGRAEVWRRVAIQAPEGIAVLDQDDSARNMKEPEAARRGEERPDDDN